MFYFDFDNTAPDAVDDDAAPVVIDAVMPVLNRSSHLTACYEFELF